MYNKYPQLSLIIILALFIAGSVLHLKNAHGRNLVGKKSQIVNLADKDIKALKGHWKVVLVNHTLRLQVLMGTGPFSWTVEGDEVIATVTRDNSNTSIATVKGVAPGSIVVRITDANGVIMRWRVDVITVDIDYSPADRRIAARSAWPQYGLIQSGTFRITATSTPDAQYRWSLHDVIKWGEIELTGGTGYTPAGKGRIKQKWKNTGGFDGWVYEAFPETRGVGKDGVKNPQSKVAVLTPLAKSDDKEAAGPIRVHVVPIFTWLRSVNHVHTNGSKHNNSKDNETDKENLRWDLWTLFLYIKWKYNIWTPNANSWSIVFDLGNYGDTSPDNNVRINETSFDVSENWLASVIVHESAHCDQDYWSIRSRIAVSGRHMEALAYQVQLQKAANVGLSEQEITEVRGCMNYFDGVAGACCEGNCN